MKRIIATLALALPLAALSALPNAASTQTVRDDHDQSQQYGYRESRQTVVVQPSYHTTYKPQPVSVKTTVKYHQRKWITGHYVRVNNQRRWIPGHYSY